MINFHPLSDNPDDSINLRDYLIIRNDDREYPPIKYSQNKKEVNPQDYYGFSKNVKVVLIELFDSDLDYVLFDSFSDIFLQSDLGTQRVIGTSESKDKTKLHEDDIKGCLQIAAMYKAIFSFLNENDREIVLDARLMLIFSLWQWLSFLKVISANYEFKELPPFLLDELSFAYKAANNHFQNSDYVDSFRFIYYWVKSRELGSGLNEFLIYSMVLMPSQEEGDSKKGGLEYNIPIIPAGFIDYNQFDWGSVILHPIFKEHRPARVAVMRLVTHHALPSYDFDAALHLAHLLNTNKPMKGKHPIWLFILAIFAIIFIPVFINNTVQPIDVPFPILNTLPTSLAVTTFSIILAASFWYMVKTYTNELIIHLLLPRVWAGILVGYSPLIFESGSVDITCTLWETRLSIAVLWLVMVAISWFYLYHDILPWAIDRHETRTRTVQTLGITLLLSVLIGFIVIPLSTMTYNHPCNYCDQILFNGIFGKVDIKQLLVFVPLAYITGLISQFIFEEKPLTTSVWAPVRE